MLDDIINNALGNLEKSSDATKVTACRRTEMSTIAQQFTLDNTVIPISNDIHIPITEKHRTSLSVSSTDCIFKKLELKICELNKSVNYELALLNKKIDSFSGYLIKFVNSSLPGLQKKILRRKYICPKEKPLYKR